MPIPSSKAILRGLAENLNPHAPAPTIADLAAWLPRSPVELWQAFGLSFVPITSGKPDRLDRLVIYFHETYVRWCQETSQDMKAAWREHPALAFVAGWQQRAVVVKPTRGAGLPRFQRMSEAEALALPGFDAQRPGPVRGQPVLPGFDVTPVGGCPSWLLSLYDQAGGNTERPGRGAPLDLRVFVGALLSVPETARDGRDVRIPITVGELADLLYPNGWNRANRRRDWESFRRSLRNLDRLRVPIEVDGHMVGVQVVNAFVIPRSWDRGQASVVLRVAIPASAARGARVNWDRLRVYGAESAPLYRAYLSVCAVLDYSARNGHGITQRIGAPQVDQHGKRIRGKGGRIIRSATEKVPNPSAKFVGKLTDDDVRRLVGLHAQHHENRKRARAALERLAGDGVIDLRTFRDGCVQIFAPDEDRKASSPGARTRTGEHGAEGGGPRRGRRHAEHPARRGSSRKRSQQVRQAESTGATSGVNRCDKRSQQVRSSPDPANVSRGLCVLPDLPDPPEKGRAESPGRRAALADARLHGLSAPNSEIPWTAPAKEVERERTRQVVRIGSNPNQIARRGGGVPRRSGLPQNRPNRLRRMQPATGHGANGTR